MQDLVRHTEQLSLLPKQYDFVTDTEHRGLMYSGAFGAGKTYALCVRRAMRASIPGAREALVRKHLVTLKRTTLRTLLEPTGDLPPVLPPGTYTHNQGANLIRLHGGGEITYFGMDDPQKIGSTNLSGIGIDEGVEISEEDFNWLRGRNRVQVRGLHNCIDTACNPGSPSHFLADLFGLARGSKPHTGYRTIRTSTYDNFFLPQDYIDDLSNLQGIAYKRYVLGEWVGSDGLVYDQFDRSVMVKSVPLTNLTGRRIAALDVGYRNPAALVIMIGDGDHIHIPYEWYKRRCNEAEIRSVVEQVWKDWDLEVVVCDPSAASMIDALHQINGVYAVAGNNKVFPGIMATQNYVCLDKGTDKPRLTVDPSCEHTILEFETYEWDRHRKKGSSDYNDVPLKLNDHAMDAIRYGVMEFERTSASLIW